MNMLDLHKVLNETYVKLIKPYIKDDLQHNAEKTPYWQTAGRATPHCTGVWLCSKEGGSCWVECVPNAKGRKCHRQTLRASSIL